MTRPEIKSIDCQQLAEILRQQPVEIIDVRTPEEFSAVHAAAARNFPIDTLDPPAILRSRTSPPEEPLYFICHLGGRSAKACAKFIAAGHPNVVNIEGGTDAWLAAGLPIGHG